MDTFVLYAFLGCTALGFVVGAVVGAVLMHDYMNVPPDPEDDDEEW